jgi:glucose/mannose-6-phosphate isomerase
MVSFASSVFRPFRLRSLYQNHMTGKEQGIMADLLDQPKAMQKLDPDGMIDLVQNFQQQCAEGENIARETTLPTPQGIHHVVICGMGGSAIGGDLLRAYSARFCTASVEVVRNYGLPAYVGPHTLLIASSYSGNTEETLSAYQQAKKRGASILAVTTGGTLLAWCQQDNNPAIVVPGGISPRAALGYSFMPLLVAFERMGLIPDQSREIKSMYAALRKCAKANTMDVPTADNPAKQLAKTLHRTVPVIYGGQDAFQPVAMRWRCQINENAKAFAHDMVVPEMNHNEILGWGNPVPVLKKFHAIYLLDSGYSPQTSKRFSVMKKIIAQTAQGESTVQSYGSGLLARMFSVIAFGDFTSVYLAYLYKEDPTPIPAIDFLKQELAR